MLWDDNYMSGGQLDREQHVSYIFLSVHTKDQIGKKNRWFISVINLMPAGPDARFRFRLKTELQIKIEERSP